MKFLIITILSFSIFISISGQDLSTRKIVLLPIISNGIDYSSSKTVESILRMELSKQTYLELISEKKNL